jgi:hypothetical protein
MPEPFMKGKFSLYETPDGGYHIAYKEDGEDTETKHIEIPGYIAQMAKKMGNGNIPNPFGAKNKV